MNPLSYDDPAQTMHVVRTTLERIYRADRLPKIHVPTRNADDTVVPNAPFHALPEIFFQLSGSNHFECGQQHFELNSSEVCIMPAGVSHVERGHGDDFSAFVIAHDASRILLLGLQCDVSPWPRAIPIRTFALDNGKFLADLLSEAAEHMNRGTEVAPHLLRSYLGSILDRIDQPEPTSAQTYSPLVSKCMDLFFTELSSADLNVAAVADRLQCNADSLSARFSKEVGQSAIHYLTELRLKQAKELLKRRSLSIAEVSWACGYRDPNYFARVFKSHIGETARSFRNSHLAEDSSQSV